MKAISLEGGTTISFRPIQPADEQLLYQIYASTRADEMALVQHWDAEQKDAFVRQQFSAQHQYYQTQFADALYLIVLVDDTPAGRLYLHQRHDEYRIIDITLLPDVRAKGVGTAILEAVLRTAASEKLPVRIHVERYNPALQLYKRLGFAVSSEENPIYYLMTWQNAPNSI